MFNKVLILSASVGAGHMRAAQAVEKAFGEMNAAREVRHIDTLEYTNKMFRRLYAKAYLDMVNRAPELLGWFYDKLDTPWENERRRLALDRLNTVPFVRLLKKEQPDVIVCTHFLPAEIVSWMKAKEKLDVPQAIVVTDADVHAMWLVHHYEQYFVALDETRAHLESLGIPPAKISVTGIPIDPVFSVPKDKAEMRRKYNLDPERTTILVSAGGFGVGNLEHLLTALAQLKHPAQVLAMCGRNAELKARVNSIVNSANVKIKAVGYTTEMDEYMSAADLVVGKPGGLTTAEALAKGLIFIVVNPIPGQEERNSDHLLEAGAALRCNNLPVLAYKIDALLDDANRLAQMRANIAQLARPHAATEIVMKLLNIT